MKVSYNWLKQYIDLDCSPEEVGNMLTGCGLEVENMETWYPVKGGLKGVVVGEVITCRKHPGSDHLSLTTVNTGSGTLLNIVCGAPNVSAGQKVPVATTGATLYFNEEETIIRKTKIRGEISEGMICAEDELGLGTGHEGIMVLNPDALPGTPCSEYFGFTEDYVFQIGLTPNRADAASHTGVARDLVAVMNNAGRDIQPADGRKNLQMPDVSGFRPDLSGRVIQVIVEDPVACPRYSGLTMTNVTVGDSPRWLQNRLLSIGIRPINNIVDITNFVLFELGQPLHAFDADHIYEDTVVVKKYPRGTRFLTLDEVERELSEHDLMICSASEPMCIAGVFGGRNSGITSRTRNIFLESACFNPLSVRRTARYHGLQTDASFRFERGTDIRITPFALKRAALLIKEIAGGEISGDIFDVFPGDAGDRIISLNYRTLDRLIGKHIPETLVQSILSDLGMKTSQEKKESIQVSVPSGKTDVTREADLIEEILRIYGYNHIEIPPTVRASLSWSEKPDQDKLRNGISDYLTSCGFIEIINNSLTRSEYYTGNDLHPVDRCVKILNPISRDLDVMRQTLLYGGLEAIMYNLNRKALNLKLFEFGKVYMTTEGNRVNSGNPLAAFYEEERLALFVTGDREKENWNIIPNPAGFYDIHAFVLGILAKLSVAPAHFTRERYHSDEIRDGLKYTRQGRDIIWCGSINRKILNRIDCRHDVFYAGILWQDLIALVSDNRILYRELPKHPAVRRDLALLLDRNIRFEEIEKVAITVEKKLLKKIGLFDIYEGEAIGSGKKSYAVSFVFQDESRTLTDDEVEQSMSRLITAFTEKLNAQIR
jgi:phenylalanyl-tRNA synthetase beta chain